MNDRLKKLWQCPYLITAMLAVVNVVIFLGLSVFGMTEDAEYLLAHGAMYVPYMIRYGQYYRLFTCIFLHFGFEHLMSNMMMLILMGMRIEPLIGRVRFLILYIGSGLIGNVASAIYDVYFEHFYVAAGASGAIFGIVGGVLFLTVMNKSGRYIRGYQSVGFSERDMIIMIVLALYSGFSNSGIDNVAHIGGLVSGFILTAVLTFTILKKKHLTFYGDDF